jgi:hypothetical protein
MSECVEPKLEAMLHAYELGMLDDSERRAFEIHLMECDTCFEKVKRFASPASLLRENPKIRSLIGETDVEPEEAEPTGAFSRLLKTLLGVSPVVRYAAAAVLVLIAGSLIFRSSFRGGGGAAKQQTITLTAVRSNAPALVHLAEDGELQVRFYIDTSLIRSGYAVSIVTLDGQTVYSRDSLLETDQEGFGVITFPTRLLKSGVYRVQIWPASDRKIPPVREYVFRAR